MRRIRLTAPRPIIALLAFVATSACGLTTSQRATVRSFSQATAALGEATSGQFVEMRNQTIRMNAARAQLAPPGTIDRRLESAFSVDAVIARTQAANAIQDYGVLLQALVDDTQEKELQTAADRFVASVRGLPGAEKRLSEMQLAAIGKLIQQAGGLLVEYKKKEAIKEIVPMTEPQIDKLCDLLAADFDPDGQALGADYVTAANELIVQADTSVRNAKDPVVRAAATDAYRLAADGRARKTLLLHAQKAARDLKAANKALGAAVTSNEITSDDLKTYAATVKTLVDTTKALQ